MEYLDIYDSEGRSLGIAKTKKEAHDQGLWHRAAHVWIVNSKGGILLQKRSPHIDSNPNMWDISVAGHISAGESDMVSALREIQEELGLSMSESDLQLIGTVKQMSDRPGYMNREINPIYVVHKDVNLADIRKQAEEVADVKYVSLDEFRVMITRNDPTLVQHAQEYGVLLEYLTQKK